MFERFLKSKQLRSDKIQKAKEEYVTFLEIFNSKGWYIYTQAVERKIENIKKQMEENGTLEGEDLKRLQLALAVWREVQRLPKTLEEKAKTK
jgi:hypothetical protein